MDDDWLVQEIEDKKRLRIRNIRTDQVALLDFKHIRDYTPDPKREYDGLRHGFFELRVQIFLRGPELVIEPYPSSAKRAAAKSKPAATRTRKAR